MIRAGRDGHHPIEAFDLLRGHALLKGPVPQLPEQVFPPGPEGPIRGDGQTLIPTGDDGGHRRGTLDRHGNIAVGGGAVALEGQRMLLLARDR